MGGAGGRRNGRGRWEGEGVKGGGWIVIGADEACTLQE